MRIGFGNVRLAAFLAIACFAPGKALAAEATKEPAAPIALDLCGTPTQIGERWGTANRQAIHRALEQYLAKAKQEKLSEETLIRRAQPFVEIVNRVAPHWIVEARAIAAAADLDANLYLSFLANWPRGIGFHECTSYAVSRQFTRDNAVFFHKNRDNVDCEQAAYVLASSAPGVNKFLAVTNASAVNCSMMVNDKGLAGSADYPARLTRKDDPNALLPEPAEPQFRGVMNDFLLRHLAERAADCSQALNIIRDFSDKGYYAGGTVNGTHWLFVDRAGTVMEVSSNSGHVVHKIHTQKVYFSRLDSSPAATRLCQATEPVDFHLFHSVSRDPSICLRSSISGMTVEIDPQHPEVLSCAWIALPAKSLALPVFMGARRTPVCLVSGELYNTGKSLNSEKSQWEALERRTYAEKQQLAGKIQGLLTTGRTAEAVELLDKWTEDTAQTQLAILKQLAPPAAQPSATRP